MDYREIIRHKIKEIRKKLHLTQEKFAESIGVEKSHIGQIESGIRNAGPKTINRIIKAHNINPHDFFQTDKKPIRTIEDTRITTIKKHPDKKRNLILNCDELMKDMDEENIREILKHIYKEKLWKKSKKKKKECWLI